MSFQLALLLKFPREVFHLAPPLPLGPEQGPRITSEIGQVAFYFDDWDAPHPNRAGARPVTVDTFFAHFIPQTFPAAIDQALTTDGHPHASVLYRWESAEEEAKHRTFEWSDEDEDDGEDDEAPGTSPEREWAEERLRELRREHARQACDRLFADPALGGYLGAVGRRMREAIRDFLTVLKTEYGQLLIPRTWPITTARNEWVLPDGSRREVAEVFVDRLLGLRSFADAGDINTLVEPHHWPEIAARLAAGRRPPALEVLLASARGECDPDLGNPRLALIEAVTVLEAEVKKLVALRLRSHGIGRAAAARVVRETPLADLAAAWIRGEAGLRATAADQAHYDRCAEAIRECHVLIRHERDDLSPGRARQHVDALGELARRARAARQADRAR